MAKQFRNSNIYVPASMLDEDECYQTLAVVCYMYMYLHVGIQYCTEPLFLVWGPVNVALLSPQSTLEPNRATKSKIVQNIFK